MNKQQEKIKVGRKTKPINNKPVKEVEAKESGAFASDLRKIISWNIHDRFYISVIYVSLFLVSFFIRFIGINLSDNGSPVFDEKHYVPQSQQIADLGIENNPSYGLVVHPFLGKRLISFGIDIFGYTPLGWRIASIIAGCLMVVLLAISVRALTKSMTLAILSGILLNTEGVTFVMSRVGMLDIFIGLFTTMAMTFFALRIATKIPLNSENMPVYKDPYLYGAGASIGLAMAIKLSGLYLSATSGVMLFIVALYMVIKKQSTIKDFIKSVFFGFISLAVIPIVIATLFWIPWFRDYFSAYRQSAVAGSLEYRLPGFLDSIAPDAIRSFYNYQAGVMNFHTGLTNSAGNLHPWESKPLDWILGNGSLLLYSDSNTQIWIASNRSIWILSALVLAVSAFMFIIKRNMTWGIVFAGFVATYVSWLFVYDRQMYIFYVVPLAPFLILGIVLMIQSMIMYQPENGEQIALSKVSLSFGLILFILMILTLAEFLLASPYIFYGTSYESFIDNNHHILKLPESFYVENWVEPKHK